MDYVKLSHDKLHLNIISDLVRHESCGAISIFEGTTRNNFEGKKVISLEYEAYEAMALKQMQTICDNLRSRWKDLMNIAIYHRLGAVPVKETSVIIAVSSPHRQTALQAVEAAIEDLKRNVPIWKKELYDDNNSSWKENNESLFYKHKENLNFFHCGVTKNNPLHNLVQIQANDEEVQRRIQCFIQKKREEINESNIKNLVATNELEKSDQCDDINTCARTYSKKVKQRLPRVDLKIHRVENCSDSTAKPNYLKALDNLMNTSQNLKKEKEFVASTEAVNSSNNLPHYFSTPLVERLFNVEDYLNMPLINTDNIYDRLKAIETRLLELEAISPEYRHFFISEKKKEDLNEKPTKPSIEKQMNLQEWDLNDLDSVVNDLEKMCELE